MTDGPRGGGLGSRHGISDDIACHKVSGETRRERVTSASGVHRNSLLSQIPATRAILMNQAPRLPERDNHDGYAQFASQRAAELVSRQVVAGFEQRPGLDLVGHDLSTWPHGTAAASAGSASRGAGWTRTRAPQPLAIPIASATADTGGSKVMSAASARSKAGAAARTVSGITATSSSMCHTIAESPSSLTKHRQIVVAAPSRTSTQRTSTRSRPNAASTSRPMPSSPTAPTAVT
jgi:hypothetical protein